ncbi:hypothetical protein GNI_118490 [Gregarina niphandrodes]|uniref:Methyl-accepting transducer domain-containing protein n=1 Tax=Gregarina niphandrodes TaxID=110365 RepID=A0A023B2L7_GRENI|nr:hypothetical protein GNI_118490 [Gregarina niphandrodes]EZG55089.1 hypothetical protein GNI_118490 [Gregarina niphandrodes]|eukprot:XP_011131792.1 hypothetical protein GNI_118490 [Gregarina niphandrodes]
MVLKAPTKRVQNLKGPVKSYVGQSIMEQAINKAIGNTRHGGQVKHVRGKVKGKGEVLPSGHDPPAVAKQDTLGKALSRAGSGGKLSEVKVGGGSKHAKGKDGEGQDGVKGSLGGGSLGGGKKLRSKRLSARQLVQVALRHGKSPAVEDLGRGKKSAADTESSETVTTFVDSEESLPPPSEIADNPVALELYEMSRKYEAHVRKIRDEKSMLEEHNYLLLSQLMTKKKMHERERERADELRNYILDVCETYDDIEGRVNDLSSLFQLHLESLADSVAMACVFAFRGDLESQEYSLRALEPVKKLDPRLHDLYDQIIARPPPPASFYPFSSTNREWVKGESAPVYQRTHKRQLEEDAEDQLDGRKPTSLRPTKMRSFADRVYELQRYSVNELQPIGPRGIRAQCGFLNIRDTGKILSTRIKMVGDDQPDEEDFEIKPAPVSDAADDSAQKEEVEDGKTKPKEGEVKEGEVKEGEAKEGEAKEGEAKEGEAKEGEAKEGEAKEGEAKEGEAKEGETKEGEAKEGEAKEGEAKEGGTARRSSKRINIRHVTHEEELITNHAVWQAAPNGEFHRGPVLMLRRIPEQTKEQKLRSVAPSLVFHLTMAADRKAFDSDERSDASAIKGVVTVPLVHASARTGITGVWPVFDSASRKQLGTIMIRLTPFGDLDYLPADLRQHRDMGTVNEKVTPAEVTMAEIQDDLMAQMGIGPLHEKNYYNLDYMEDVYDLVSANIDKMDPESLRQLVQQYLAEEYVPRRRHQLNLSGDELANIPALYSAKVVQDELSKRQRQLVDVVQGPDQWWGYNTKRLVDMLQDVSELYYYQVQEQPWSEAFRPILSKFKNKISFDQRDIDDENFIIPLVQQCVCGEPNTEQFRITIPVLDTFRYFDIQVPKEKTNKVVTVNLKVEAVRCNVQVDLHNSVAYLTEGFDSSTKDWKNQLKPETKKAQKESATKVEVKAVEKGKEEKTRGGGRNKLANRFQEFAKTDQQKKDAEGGVKGGAKGGPKDEEAGKKLQVKKDEAQERVVDKSKGSLDYEEVIGIAIGCLDYAELKPMVGPEIIFTGAGKPKARVEQKRDPDTNDRLLFNGEGIATDTIKEWEAIEREPGDWPPLDVPKIVINTTGEVGYPDEIYEAAYLNPFFEVPDDYFLHMKRRSDDVVRARRQQTAVEAAAKAAAAKEAKHRHEEKKTKKTTPDGEIVEETEISSSEYTSSSYTGSSSSYTSESESSGSYTSSSYTSSSYDSSSYSSSSYTSSSYDSSSSYTSTSGSVDSYSSGSSYTSSAGYTSGETSVLEPSPRLKPPPPSRRGPPKKRPPTPLPTILEEEAMEEEEPIPDEEMELGRWPSEEIPLAAWPSEELPLAEWPDEQEEEEVQEEVSEAPWIDFPESEESITEEVQERFSWSGESIEEAPEVVEEEEIVEEEEPLEEIVEEEEPLEEIVEEEEPLEEIVEEEEPLEEIVEEQESLEELVEELEEEPLDEFLEEPLEDLFDEKIQEDLEDFLEDEEVVLKSPVEELIEEIDSSVESILEEEIPVIVLHRPEEEEAEEEILEPTIIEEEEIDEVEPEEIEVEEVPEEEKVELEIEEPPEEVLDEMEETVSEVFDEALPEVVEEEIMVEEPVYDILEEQADEVVEVDRVEELPEVREEEQLPVEEIEEQEVEDELVLPLTREMSILEEKREDIVERMPTMVEELSVEELPEAIEEIPAPIEELPEVVEELPEVIGELPEVIEELPEVVEELPAIIEELPAIVEELPEVIEELPEVIEELPEVIEELPEVIEELPEVVEELPEVVEELPEVIEELPEVVEELPEVVEQLPEVIEELPEVMEELPEVIEELPEVVEELPEVIEELPEVVEELPEVVEELPEVIEELPEAVEELPEVVEELPDVIEGLPEMVEELPEVIEELPEMVEELPERCLSLSPPSPCKRRRG